MRPTAARRTSSSPSACACASDAMYHSVVSGMSKDHILISCITREGEILNALKRNLPNVRAVHVPHTTCGAFMAFISMKKTADGEPQMAIMGTFGTELYTKYVIVVDDDVDIFDLNDVMWAIATRVRAEKDIVLHPRRQGGDPRPHLRPRDLHADQDGHRRDPPARARLRRAAGRYRRRARQGARRARSRRGAAVRCITPVLAS